MVSAQFSLSTTQIAAVSEAFIACALTIESGGRLSVYNPFADDFGIDLIAVDKATGTSAQLQVKAWTYREQEKQRVPQFDLRKATYSAEENALLLALHLQLSPLRFHHAWLIPMPDIPLVSTGTPTKYVLKPSIKSNNRDRYGPYRYEDAGALSAALLDTMAE